jgi:hypothetical protein
METHDSIIALIDDNSEIINFGDSTSSPSEDAITSAQKRLNLKFPPSYVWWLKNYGGGEILGEEVFSIYESDSDALKPGDVIYVNELNRKRQFSDINQLVIQETDQSEMFYLDVQKADNTGEYPVYCSFGQKTYPYADNFLDFLAKRIKGS